MWGMGRFVYWNVKYYLFCRKLCQSQREMWLPVGFSLLFYKITFCMSSLLFDCYLNGLSVCLVLVVNLLWQHLMFLLLLPNHLSYTSKVNAHSFFSPLSILFLLMITSFSVFVSSSSWQSKWHIQRIHKRMNSNRKIGLLDSNVTQMSLLAVKSVFSLIKHSNSSYLVWLKIRNYLARVGQKVLGNLITKLHIDHSNCSTIPFVLFSVFRVKCMRVW